MSRGACPSCGIANPPAARFCMACGAALKHVCEGCGMESPARAAFCIGCGATLEAPPRVADQPQEERRLVSVLFADLAGWTAASERLDPEEARRVNGAVLLRLGEEVDRFGGRLDSFAGDGLMAFWGAPAAHEDDAERAVRAGLAMQSAMREVNDRLRTDHGLSFELRVGVNTGEVLAGALGDQYSVTGDVVNTAARLESAARTGAVTVGERTHRATHEAVDYRELEPLKLKGKAQPVRAWEAVRAHGPIPQPRTVNAETPLVGRERELDLLAELQRRTVAEGRSHLLTVVGAAGVGKSRLLREAVRRFEKVPSRPRLLVGRCPAYGASIVYWALGELLRADAEIREGDPADVARRKLMGRLEDLLGNNAADEEALDRRVAVIGRFLGIEMDRGSGEADDDPERAREAFFAAIRVWVEATARRRPLVLAFEDIHWADDGMLDLIEYMSQFARAPLLIVCLARSELLERHTAWGAGRRTQTLTFLDPLDSEQTHALLAALLPEDDSDLAARVANRAGGNPLFAEEMARHIHESGNADVGELPDTIHGLLAARLDSLPPAERRLLQHAAVVGRVFDENALAPVAAAEQVDLAATLAALCEKDLIAPGGGNVGATELAFKHVLMRDVAYATLPKAVRARKHFEVGNVLERRSGDRGDEIVAVLAEHYGRAFALAREGGFAANELASIAARAAVFHEAAGDAAASVYSNREALEHYDAALQTGARADPAAHGRIAEKLGDIAARVGRLDDAVARWREARDASEEQRSAGDVARLLGKAGAALGRQGHRQEAVEHLRRGINAVKDAPPTLDLVRLYEEAARVFLSTGDNLLAVYAAEKALRLAERLGEAHAASRAHGVFGGVLGRMGHTAKAREHLELSVELGRDAGHADTLVALMALAQHLDAAEAEYAAAGAVYEEALALAERLGDVADEIELLLALAQLAAHRADWEEVERRRQESERLADGEGLTRRRAVAVGLAALLAWRDGNLDEAERLYDEALGLAEDAGWSEVRSSLLHGMAINRHDKGNDAGAVAALDAGLEACERAGLATRVVQLKALKVVILAAAGRPDESAATAAEITPTAAGFTGAVARAAALEADGVTTGEVERVREAEVAWRGLGRPLDAARATLLLGDVGRAAAEFERLGIPHLAEQARMRGLAPPPRKTRPADARGRHPPRPSRSL